MKLRIRTFVVAWLAFFLAPAGAARAELGQDTHIQETGEIRIEVDRQVYEEFAHMFEAGYPPATIMMHAVSTGMSLNDILYIAVRSNLNRAQEFYDTADSLLPALPGWVCQGEVDRERYTRAVDSADLGDEPTIRQVADLYFDDNRRVVPFPDWLSGTVHMAASVDELAGLVSDEQWYVPGDNDGTPRTVPNRPVFVSLYRHSGEIVVDQGVDTIRQAQEQGIDRLPVVLVYNDSLHRHISGFDSDITVAELAQEFYGEGIQLTAVPEWQVGDFHKFATVDELEELVDLPNREDVQEERWTSIEQSIRDHGMRLPRPLLLTLVRSGGGNAWVDDPTTLAVASELGVDQLPVVLFYHEIDRNPCGQPSSCEAVLCEAAMAAGAPEEVCRQETQQASAARPGVEGESGLATGLQSAAAVDLRLYQGLSYTQNQCTS